VAKLRRIKEFNSTQQTFFVNSPNSGNLNHHTGLHFKPRAREKRHSPALPQFAAGVEVQTQERR
jgi:hypothetical protein